MMGIGKMTKHMVQGLMSTLMEPNTLEIGLMISKMVLGKKSGPMAHLTKAFTRKVKSRVREGLFGLMGLVMRVLG